MLVPPRVAACTISGVLTRLSLLRSIVPTGVWPYCIVFLMPGKRSYVSAVPGTLTQAQLRRQERDRPFLPLPPPPPPVDVPGRRPLWTDFAVDHGEPPSSGLYLHSSSSARAPTPPPPNERGDEWREEDLVLLSDSFVLDKDVSLPMKVFLAEQFYVGDSEEEEHPIGGWHGGHILHGDVNELLRFEDAPTCDKGCSLPVPFPLRLRQMIRGKYSAGYCGEALDATHISGNISGNTENCIIGNTEVGNTDVCMTRVGGESVQAAQYDCI